MPDLLATGLKHMTTVKSSKRSSRPCILQERTNAELGALWDISVMNMGDAIDIDVYGSTSYGELLMSYLTGSKDADNPTLLYLSALKFKLLRRVVKQGSNGLRYYVNPGGTDACPLCWLYHDNECWGCPIYIENSQHWKCKSTAYEDIVKSRTQNLVLAALNDEIRFLHEVEDTLHESVKIRSMNSLKMSAKICQNVPKKEKVNGN